MSDLSDLKQARADLIKAQKEAKAEAKAAYDPDIARLDLEIGALEPKGKPTEKPKVLRK